MPEKIIVVLDPGHGLSKDGKFERPLCSIKGNKVLIDNNFELNEKDSSPKWYREDIGVLALAREIRTFLEEMGYEVHLTRDDIRDVHQNIADKFSLSQWKRDNWTESKYVRFFCKEVKSDIFVSLHTNALSNQKANGTIGFWRTPAGCDLAETIVNQIIKDTKIKMRRKGIAKRNFIKLRDNSKGRCCLIEAGFHTNVNNLKILNSPKGLKEIGKAIAIGIDKYSRKTFE